MSHRWLVRCNHNIHVVMSTQWNNGLSGATSQCEQILGTGLLLVLKVCRTLGPKDINSFYRYHVSCGHLRSHLIRYSTRTNKHNTYSTCNTDLHCRQQMHTETYTERYTHYTSNAINSKDHNSVLKKYINLNLKDFPTAKLCCCSLYWPNFSKHPFPILSYESSKLVAWKTPSQYVTVLLEYLNLYC